MTWEQLRLTDLGAIDGLHVALEHDKDGWHLRIWHRHVGGNYADCGDECYERLTLAEALDVLEATATTFGH